MIFYILAAVFEVASLPVVLICAYLALLALLSRRPLAQPYGTPHIAFDIIVPAHNEELGIAATVQSLQALEYPAKLRRILVVADNCTDNTAAKAMEAGATVLERHDEGRRGKGYALEVAFEKSLRERVADAVVVVDADTFVEPALLSAFAAGLERGEHVLQGNYGVLNPRTSWRTRLMTLALTLFNDVRSLGRERLQLSVGLKGNGMCFSHQALQAVPHKAYSLVEDLEYGIQLGRAGYRVAYASDAEVKGEMVSSEQAARSQRRRWEGGRMAMAKSYAGPLLQEGIEKRSLMLFEQGVDLLVPPLTYVVLAAGGGTFFAFCIMVLGGVPLGTLAPWLLADLCLAVYLARGLMLSGMGLRGVLDLFWAPVFIVWKLVLLVSRKGGGGKGNAEWVRTTREGESRSNVSQR